MPEELVLSIAEVTKLIGKHRLNIKVYGKESGYVKTSEKIQQIIG